MDKKGSFQKHIAGLRAVAIILILLFHLNGNAWPQGYLGVDVFLVITGYLLILGGKRQEQAWGKRDTAGYLGKRLRRVVPPMAGIIVITVGLGG